VSNDESTRRVEVPVKRIEITITLDDILSALARHAGSPSLAGEQPGPAAEQLQRLGRLAEEMRAALAEVAQLDPDLHARLEGPGISQ